MGGRHSRNKGARVERLLRDELLRMGWSDVVRVPLSGAVKTRVAYQDDVVGRPPGWGSEVRFECKARATGFDKIYTLPLTDKECVRCHLDTGEIITLSLNPNLILHHESAPHLSTFSVDKQKVLNSVFKKCRDWIGGAMVLALKQDRCPFIYIRYHR